MLAFNRARGETRTPKVITPTASETATFANFATRACNAFCIFKERAQDESRTRTVSRHPLKVVRLPVSPPGQYPPTQGVGEGLQK